MIRLFVATVFSGWLLLPAVGATLDAAAINNSEFRSKPVADDKIEAVVVKAEVLLDRAHFSPAKSMARSVKTREALRAFAEAKGLASDKALTPEVWALLTGTSKEAAIAEHTISESDVKGPFLRKLPTKMEDMKRLKALSYTGPREALAEKFHMSEGLLVALNPGKKFDKAGEIIFVTNILNKQTKLSIDRIEVDKSRQTVKAFDPSGTLVAFLPGDRGKRGEADSNWKFQGRLCRCQPVLSL